MVIEGIRSMLQNEKEIEWMGHTMNATSWLAFFQHQQADVILMGINMPDISITAGKIACSYTVAFSYLKKVRISKGKWKRNFGPTCRRGWTR